MKIAIVDDDNIIRIGLSKIVEKLNDDYKVVGSFQNGALALDYLKKHGQDIDLVITDIKMPVMDGIELSKRIKEVIPEVYIIILTNFAEFSYAKEAISCGVYEYLIKSDIRPKELSEILNKINAIIKSKIEIKDEEKLDKHNIVKPKAYSRSIEKALKYIDDNYKKHISLMDVAKHIYLSHEYFSRLFKEEVGENFSTYLTIYRIKKAKELIKNTDMKISQIALEVGYSNAGYFSKNYKRYTGISPEEDRYW